MRTKKIFSALVVVFASSSSNANWVDSWVDNATYGGGTSYETQNRKFLTGGNFSVRSQVRTDYPLTISMPKISAGCGGIDGFMGGVSFLDADYLVDKLQRMMQAAPYVAMDMALKTMSKEFSDTLKAAEDMVNALNSIQLNECQSMKPVVTAALNSDPEGMKSAMGEIANAQQIKEAGVRLWQEAKDKTADNNGKSPVDTTKETEGCPAAVNDIFGGGSVIKKVAEKTGLSSHVDLIRGYFGDVVMIKADNIITAQTVGSCPDNTDDHQGFLFGGAFGKNEAGVCTKQTGATVHETIYKKVDSIANKLINNQALNSEDIQFASVGMPLPIVKMLQVSMDDGTIDQQKTVLADIAAATYSRRIADTFFNAAYESLKLASDAAKDTTQLNNNKTCNMRIYADGANKVRALLKDVQQARSTLNRNIDLAIQESTQFYDVTAKSRERFDSLKEEDNSFFRGQ